KACGCRLANRFAASELQDHLRLDAGPAERLTDDALGIRAVFAGDHRLSIEILEIYALATRPGLVVGDDQYASVMPQGDSVYLRMLLDPRQNCNVGVAVEQLLLYEPAVPHCHGEADMRIARQKAREEPHRDMWPIRGESEMAVLQF